MLFGEEERIEPTPLCKFLPGILDQGIFKKIKDRLSGSDRRLSADLDPLINLKTLSLREFAPYQHQLDIEYV